MHGLIFRLCQICVRRLPLLFSFPITWALVRKRNEQRSLLFDAPYGRSGMDPPEASQNRYTLGHGKLDSTGKA